MGDANPIVAFLSLPGEEQIELLPGIPYDRGAPTFYTAFRSNPLWIATQGLVLFLGYDDHVPYEDWCHSVGLPDDWEKGALPDLLFYLSTLTGGYDHFTQRALGRAVEWRIVRRLARAALADLEWRPSTSPDEVAAVMPRLRRALREQSYL